MGGDEIDARRLALFCGFGAFTGATTFTVYCSMFKRICPGAFSFSNLTLREKLRDRCGQLALLKQVALDNFLYVPSCYFPSFHVFKANLRSESAEDVQASVLAGIRRYRASCVDDNFYSCAVWIPADILVFSVPAWLRMPICNSINFGWTVFLSRLSGADLND